MKHHQFVDLAGRAEFNSDVNAELVLFSPCTGCGAERVSRSGPPQRGSPLGAAAGDVCPTRLPSKPGRDKGAASPAAAPVPLRSAAAKPLAVCYTMLKSELGNDFILKWGHTWVKGRRKSDGIIEL